MSEINDIKKFVEFSKEITEAILAQKLSKKDRAYLTGVLDGLNSVYNAIIDEKGTKEFISFLLPGHNKQ